MAANTYTLISSTTVVGSTTSQVDLTSIPATYTDLVVRLSIRSNDGGGVYDDTYVRFNSSSATTYSTTLMQGNGATAISSRSSTVTALQNLKSSVGSGATASTFNNYEIYIPSYTASQNKPISGFAVTENNATTAYASGYAGLWQNTAAITTISFTPVVANFFAAGSSFYLYGIKNS